MDTRSISESFLNVRRKSAELCSSLETEDYVIQTMPDVSPAKWHLGHTSWFFEIFVLREFVPGYSLVNEHYPFIFNSYYNHAGDRVYRPHRGFISRPTVRQVFEYRRRITEETARLLETAEQLPDAAEILRRVEIGVHHEQQHQELFLTDIKHVFFQNVMRPALGVKASAAPSSAAKTKPRYIEYEGGLHEFGRARAGFGENGGDFSYDNETPVHRAYLEDFSLRNRPVTNGEYLEFISDGGYRDFRHWLSDGWDLVHRENWEAPLYWEKKDDAWFVYTLNGSVPLDENEPVSHVSFHEAHAYASWAGVRLPGEYEWELAARASAPDAARDNFMESGALHPRAPGSENGARHTEQLNSEQSNPEQLYGDVWEWTRSAYLPYPGFSAEDGALGEYNGKFMNDQRVLRGGSCATPASHMRATYRNFFQGDKRWQFSGIRPAK